MFFDKYSTALDNMKFYSSSDGKKTATTNDNNNNIFADHLLKSKVDIISLILYTVYVRLL